MENSIKGLSNAEARRILAQIGPNATPDVAIHPLRLVLGKFLAPVSVLLEIAIVLQLVLGEYVEGSIIGALLIFNTAIGFFHETRAQATIAALKSRLALKASVLRDAFAVVYRLSQPAPEAERVADELEKHGHRVLGVAIGTDRAMRIIGIVALSDPPRSDSKPMIDQLRSLGAHTVMVTGDAATTAAFVADAVGLTGAVCPLGQIPDRVGSEDFAVFAGVLPEDKFRLVKAFQNAGHTVGMCGDGANDAPALRQAQIGIAVSSATDVAKSAAGIVLTEPGLGGIVASVREGRITFQRILTYALRAIVHKSRQVLFLGFGLILTGHAILTPTLMVISMVTGDFLAMSSTTDNVRPSSMPNSWRIDTLTVVGIALGLFDLAFCAGLLTVGSRLMHLDIDTLRTMTLVILALNGQAVFYVVRERKRLWSSRPSLLVILSSIVDVLIIGTLALGGILMAPLAPSIVGAILAAAIVLALIMDQVKFWLFAHFKMT
jgi:H+-transporting ATPase